MSKTTINEENVILNNLSIPIVWKGDVLVAGGGPGGIGAAIAANRLGKKTIIIEAQGFLGGMASYGAGMPLGGAYPGLKSIGGIAEEILTRIRNAGKDTADIRHVKYFGDWYYHDSEYFKSMLAEMVKEESLKVCLHSFVIDVIMHDKRHVSGVITASKSGFQAFIAKTIIDASGDADVCARAGARFEIGDENGDLMAMTIPFNLGGCDSEQFDTYHESDKDFEKAKEKAKALGIEVSDEDRFLATASGVKPGWIFNNAIRVRNYDGTDVESLTQAELEARRRILQHLYFFRAVIPGCEDAYIANTACTIGIRDTRRIIGEEYLSTEDCLNLRKQPNRTILRCAGPFDNATRGNKNNPHNSIDISQYYDIPYGCIVPADLGNVLVSGRTFSSSALAQSGSRGQALLMGMGQAAGTAACLACDSNIEMKDVDVANLQAKLQNDGCCLF